MVQAQALTGVALGRPRNDDREKAILEATLTLVAELGYERLTLDGVALRAQASKATIYRRWSGKEELVVAAVRCYSGEMAHTAQDTGSLRSDLLSLCMGIATNLAGFDGHLILGLARSALSSPSLCQVLKAQTCPEAADLPKIVVERAITRGELPSGANPLLFTEIVTPLIIMRLITGEPLTESFFHHVIDAILLPALAHPADTSPTGPSPTIHRSGTAGSTQENNA